MLTVGSCLLFDLCCSERVVCCVLFVFVVCSSLFDVRCLMFVVLFEWWSLFVVCCVLLVDRVCVFLDCCVSFAVRR